MYVCPLFHAPGWILMQCFSIISTCFLQDDASPRAKLQLQVKNNSLFAWISHNAVCPQDCFYGTLFEHASPHASCDSKLIFVRHVSKYLLYFAQKARNWSFLVIFSSNTSHLNEPVIIETLLQTVMTSRYCIWRHKQTVKNMPVFWFPALGVQTSRQHYESGRSIWNTSGSGTILGLGHSWTLTGGMMCL